MPAPGSQVGTQAGTEVRMALEKRSSGRAGWEQFRIEEREIFWLFLPHKQGEPCAGVLGLLMESAVTLWQGALSGTEHNRILVPSLSARSFSLPKDMSWFSWPLQYIKFHHFLQLHFDQFVIAVLDLSYTSISTQAQEVLCQAKLSSKKSILSIVEISEGYIFPSFHCS